MNHEEDKWKMSMQPGLYSQQNYDKFAEEWYDTVLCEAKKWCRNDEAAHLLTKAVLNDCRHRFAAKKPPSDPEYYLKAQVCLVYSMTGQKIERLKNYIQDHPFTEESQDSEITDDSEAAAETEPLPDPDAGGTTEFEKVLLSDEHSEEETPRAEEKPDLMPQGKPDTFFDPVRTEMWSPEGGNNPHIIEKIVIEDDDADEEERSVGLSFLNTILFLMTAASTVFFFYETGAIQFLLR